MSKIDMGSNTSLFLNCRPLGGVYGAAGEVLAMVGYGPYGAPSTHNAGAAPAFSYTGKPYDAATGLYHFPYRQYDPNAARWLTRDPLGMVDGPNVYAYVMGNPVGAVDPLGLFGGGWGGPGIPDWDKHSDSKQACKDRAKLLLAGCIAVAEGGDWTFRRLLDVHEFAERQACKINHANDPTTLKDCLARVSDHFSEMQRLSDEAWAHWIDACRDKFRERVENCEDCN